MSLDFDAARTRFRHDRCHHVVIPAWLAESRASVLRKELDDVGFEAFHEPDRGRYAINRTFAVPELFKEVRELAENVVERTVTPGAGYWVRHQHRDYSLIKGDAKSRHIEAKYIEVTLDFSARALDQAEIVYTDGMESWVVPQQPGSVAIVERDTWLYRYERYLDHRVGDALLYRLRLALL